VSSKVKQREPPILTLQAAHLACLQDGTAIFAVCRGASADSAARSSGGSPEESREDSPLEELSASADSAGAVNLASFAASKRRCSSVEGVADQDCQQG